MVTIVFTKDFATKKKGDEWTCDSLLASHLIRIDKVAKLKTSKKKKGK
jgi:hypothetical protein